MRRTYVVTGAASGIGRSTARYLRDAGHRVIDADIKDATVTADLSAPDGRVSLLRQVEALAPEGIDGIAAVAGLSPPATPAKIVAVNYFGAIAVLEGLRPLLAQSARPRCVAVASTAALLECPDALVQLCLDGMESEACRLAEAVGEASYLSSKKALVRWLRRSSVSAAWGGSGICLNAVAPGATRTAMTAPLLETEQGRALLDASTPRVVQTIAEPEDLAEVIGGLLLLETKHVIGQIIYVDGGTDCLFRPELV